jgi:hypothetical protein
MQLGRFHREVKTLRDLRVQQGANLSEIVFLIGQADLLARYDVTDFRAIINAEYPAPESRLHVLNWIFSVPVLRVGDQADPAKTIRFVTHVRLRRGIYAHHGVDNERRILGHMRDALIFAGCSAEIQAGLGWADFIIDGSFEPSRLDHFAEFLIDIYEGAFVDSDKRRHPVCLRTLTLLGYRWPDDPSGFVPPGLPDAKPVMFVRADPGHIAEALRYVRQDISSDLDIRMIDGKSDFVVNLRRAVPSLLRGNLDLVERLNSAPTPDLDGITPSRHPIQKLETHLIFRKPAERNANNRRSVIAKVENPPPQRCRCLGPLEAYDVDDRLPQEVRQSIHNVLFLFGTALRDQMSCCDAAPAIRSAKRGLTRLMAILRDRHRRRQELDADYDVAYAANRDTVGEVKRQIVHVGKQIERNHHLFGLWHLLSERVLRQRTVASFDEMLSQTDRAVVYRGSVQKFLLLADSLMNDFAARIRGGAVPPLFASLYDSESRIFSLPQTGLVRIPARHLFTLPSVIPDLWHEVGVYWFFLKVQPNAFGLSSLTDGHERETLGDRFGDLVVYHHGFGGDPRRFLVSMTRAWLDSHQRDTLSPAIYRDEFRNLLTRLGFAMEVARRWDDVFGIGSALSKGKAMVLIEELYAFISTAFEDIPVLNDAELAVAAGTLLHEVRRFGDALAEQFRKTVSLQFDRTESWRRCAAFVEQYDGTMTAFDSGWDMNDLMGELYWFFQQHYLTHTQSPVSFQKMAGISRSAILEYQRRQSSFTAPPSAARAP